jgi:hypothetical protein
MATEFRVVIQDRPGTLAQLGSVLGEAWDNIEAIQGVSREGKGFVQFVPNEPERPVKSWTWREFPIRSGRF